MKLGCLELLSRRMFLYLSFSVVINFLKTSAVLAESIEKYRCVNESSEEQALVILEWVGNPGEINDTQKMKIEMQIPRFENGVEILQHYKDENAILRWQYEAHLVSSKGAFNGSNDYEFYWYFKNNVEFTTARIYAISKKECDLDINIILKCFRD